MKMPAFKLICTAFAMLSIACAGGCGKTLEAAENKTSAGTALPAVSDVSGVESPLPVVSASPSTEDAGTTDTYDQKTGADNGVQDSYLSVKDTGKPRCVCVLTGLESSNDAQKKWEVGGTDLGILFGDSTIYMAFGDTFGSITEDGQFGGNWRSNVLAVINDDDPSDGLTFDSFITEESSQIACQFIPGVQNGMETGLHGGFQVTTIPTGGFEINDILYVTYMSVNRWGTAGMWDCNYGGIAKSEDKGKTWRKLENLRWPGDSNFVQMAPAKIGDYVYFWCIKAGRFSGVKLMRVKQSEVENFDEYEYYQTNDASGHPVYKKGADRMSSAKQVAAPPVGELSVVYNHYIGGWLMAYYNEKAGSIQLRSSPAPEGEWSKPLNIVKGADYPMLYGGFMHPKLVLEGGKKIYLAVSQWLPVYNVKWLEVELIK